MSFLLPQPDEGPSESDTEQGRLGNAKPEWVVGCKVSFQWKQRGGVRWYTGMVDKYDAAKKQHHVTYEDGDSKWYNMDDVSSYISSNVGRYN